MTNTVPIQTVILALKTLTLVLGAVITVLSYRAYRRTGERPLQLLSVGFGVVTFGSLLAGIADQILNLGFQFGQLVETALLAVGFAVILYSLYVTN